MQKCRHNRIKEDICHQRVVVDEEISCAIYFQKDSEPNLEHVEQNEFENSEPNETKGLLLGTKMGKILFLGENRQMTQIFEIQS